MDYIIYFFELNLLKDLGYDTNLKKITFNNRDLTEIIKIKIDTFTYDIPSFLITKELPKTLSNSIIKKSLFYKKYYQNRFFLPNNLTFPKSRILLENYFN